MAERTRSALSRLNSSPCVGFPLNLHECSDNLLVSLLLQCAHTHTHTHARARVDTHRPCRVRFPLRVLRVRTGVGGGELRAP
jgi:hypothetical protein